MLTFTRDTKRLTIVVVYLLILFLILAGVFFLLRPAATCFDGKQNQDEQGIDCGGACANVCIARIEGNDLLVREIAFVPADRGRYDIIARVFNPNNDIGASSFRYALFLRDASGQELTRVQGTSFILPQETKTLLAFNLEPSRIPVKAVIELSDFQWTRTQDHRAKPALNIYGKRYVERPDPSVFGAVVGTLVNESTYDLRTIHVKVVLRDAAGTPLAANQSEMKTVTVGREQDLRIVFPQSFAGTVAQVDAEVEANTYDTENFIQRYDVPSDTPQRTTGSGGQGL
ncbi:MAG: hypothetical protein WBO92_03560 [Candidatus Moraniibacteriota bacterium]